MRYADMHCDTLMEAFFAGKQDIEVFPNAMTDVQRLEQGECMLQFFAMFLPCDDLWEWYHQKPVSDEVYLEQCMRIFNHTMERCRGKAAQAETIAQVEENNRQGLLSAVLTLEDGRFVQGKTERIDMLYQKGVRMIGLTWNAPNCFGAPNSRDAGVMAMGLTPFGRDAVCHMNEIGMAVDVSHLSDGGFYDVADISKVPFVASHSNCRQLCSHPRNLTDDMLRVLGSKGGVAGLNLGPEFLDPTPGNEKSTLTAMSAHIRHMISIGGIECAAIGTDFDGIEGQLEIGGADQMQALFHQLHKDGLTESQIDKIAYQNVLRVFKDIWK